MPTLQTRLALSALCLALTLTLCMPMRSRAQGARPTVPPSTQYIPSHDYDQRNIKLDLRFDWEHEQAYGTAAITFAPLVNDLRRVEFDAARMTFNSVKLDNGTPLQFAADDAHEKLRVTLDRAYQPTDVLTLVIDYRTNGVAKERGIAGFGRGLTFIKPRPGDAARPRQIWSQGETEYNHYWFPCYDHPNDFTTTEIVATVEKPLQVISNGRLVNTRENSDGTRTFDWKIDQPHATYLTSIVVGEYTPVTGNYAGVPVTSYVYPNEANEGRLTTSRLPEMVKFFSEKTGVKYPYAKYAQTMTRDFGGGMENISATTQTDNMILDARAMLDRDSDGLESHELAHQWFGDFVTCRTWADIWLNESFATYFQALWDEHRLGRDDFLYADVKGNQDQYYTAWARGNRRPIVTKFFAGPDAVFDTYAYPRGGAVLHMLRFTLGEENWWRAINHYLTKYAHQPVETEQFRIAIEEATGQSMDQFFDEWVYRMGHPVFRVTQNYDEATKQLTLTVRQEQKPVADAPYPQAGLFRTPVEIEIGTTTGAHVERVMIEPKEEQTFTFNSPTRPALVNFDYHGALIKQLTFDKPTDDLAYQLAHDEDVLGRIWALGQLATRLKNDATTAPERERIAGLIAAAATGDQFWGARLEAAVALNGTDDKAARASLIAAAKDKDARVRARAITSLAATKDATLAPVYEQALGDQSYGVIRAAAPALGQTKSTDAYARLTRLLDEPSWHDQVRASALLGLAALADPRSLDVALRYAAQGNAPAVRAGAITLLAAVGKDDPRAFNIIADALAQGAATGNFPLLTSSADALLTQTDEARVRQALEAAKRNAVSPNAQRFLEQFEQRLQRRAQTPANGNKPQP